MTWRHEGQGLMAKGWVPVHALRDKTVVTSHVMNRLKALFVVTNR
jgi:hypothetical protein